MKRKKVDLIDEICDYINVGSWSKHEINMFRRDLRRVSKPGLCMILTLVKNMYL